MRAAAEKKFRVTAPDRIPPDPKTWRLTSPAPGTKDPLRVSFSEPLDHALALRLITVAEVPGQQAMSDDGVHWTFLPAKPWTAGPYRLVIQPELEDLAGNSVGKPFEVDLAGTDQNPPAPRRPVEIPFP